MPTPSYTYDSNCHVFDEELHILLLLPLLNVLLQPLPLLNHLLFCLFVNVFLHVKMLLPTLWFINLFLPMNFLNAILSLLQIGFSYELSSL
jgi:hypothetical protein